MAPPSTSPRIPSSFFEGVDKVPARTTITSDLHQPNRPNSHSPSKAMYWYDAIIDDMFANPGTTHKATAARLGRSAVTIGYIVNSDLFKARYSQRRDQFNEDLDTRIVGKLAKVTELALDLTLESLEKKRTAVPLPLLHEVADKALNRLGYGPKPSAGAAVAVTVNNANGPQQIIAPVSAEALAAARSTLRTLEEGRATAARPILEEGRVATARPLARPIEQDMRTIEGSSAHSDGDHGAAEDEERGGGGGLGAL